MTELQFKEIPLDHIRPDPAQPRRLFDSLEDLTAQAATDSQAKAILEKLTELATSILEVGLQQPVAVYPAAEAERYIILDGHRRWLAMRLLQQQGQGPATIPATIHPAPASEESILLSQLNANIQREDLNVFELARSSRKLKEYLQAEGGTVRLVREDGSLETVALEPGQPDNEVWEVIEKKMGIGRSRRYQIQAVLNLPPHIQARAEAGGLAESRLRYLIPIKDERIQETILDWILAENPSNAAIKRRIRALELEMAQAEIPQSAMPKPMRIRSAIKPINKLAKELSAVPNVPAAISAKDPRTVESYREVIPELRLAVAELSEVLARLEFLEGNREDYTRV